MGEIITQKCSLPVIYTCGGLFHCPLMLGLAVEFALASGILAEVSQRLEMYV